MKNMIVLAFALASFAAAAQSGTERMGTPSFGPRQDDASIHLIPIAGLSVSNLEGTQLDSGAGYQIGGYGEFGSGYVQYQSGITYNTYEQQFKFIFVDIKVREEYLSLPNSVRINVMGDPTRTVYFKLGLIPSFLTAQKYETDGWWKEKGSTDIFRKFQLLAQGAVGGAIRAGPGAVIVEGTYFKGLTSALKKDAVEGESKSYGTLSGVLISGGYSFPF